MARAPSRRSTESGSDLLGLDLTVSHSVMAQMRHVYRAMMRGFEKRIERHGVSMGIWYFLRVLWEEDGLSQAEVRERVGIGQPTAVAAIARLARLGLVEQRSDPQDKRKVRIFLTPAGRELQPKLMPEAADYVGNVLSALSSDEIESLRSILTKIASQLGDHLPPAIYAELVPGEKKQTKPKRDRQA